MSKNVIILLIIAVISSYAYAQDKWIWAKSKNQKILGYYPTAPKKVYYTDELHSRADRDREPTTKKPLPGELANDDIDDDYPDNNEQTAVKQNNPFLPGGNIGFGGQFGGVFNQYPQFGGGAAAAYPGSPSILVGPGGPTGVIGRPQAQYPAAYPGHVDYPGYPSYNAQPYAGSINPNFPGYNGAGQQYYPGQQPTYPNTQPQFGAGGGQYPGFSPQYTEGYGFSNLQPQLNPQQHFNGFPGGYSGYPNGGGGFDEYPSQTIGKSASVKTNQKKIDDKVAKNLKNH